MARSNSPSVVTVRLESPVSRFLLLLPALLAICACWFVVRWYVGNTVAEYSSGDEQGAIDMARLAERWAPADPFTHWRVGALEEQVFSADNLADAVREYQLAVTLSPYDYRYWMELAGGLEATGDQTGSERALRRAIELAPAYAQPRWFFGNVLLRQGKVDEAFVQLATAAQADDQMRPQVLNLAWQVFGGDVDTIARVACPSANLRAQFALYLVSQQRFDDALRMWSSLNANDRAAQRDLGNALKQSLLEAKQFHAALQIMRDVEPDAADSVAGQFWNGGFEIRIPLGSAMIFHWNINSRPQAQIVTDDDQPHGGHRSLRITFGVPTKLDSIPVSQTIVVEPGSQYRLECYARTRALNSGSTPQILILDAADNSTLAASPPLPTGTNDWQKITFDFKTKPRSDGITVTMYRAPCGEAQLCPIFGNVWYDDFNLQRISGSGSSR